jgi:hypothetical protein
VLEISTIVIRETLLFPQRTFVTVSSKRINLAVSKTLRLKQEVPILLPKVTPSV